MQWTIVGIAHREQIWSWGERPKVCDPPLPELPCDPQPSKRTMNSRGTARNVKKLGDKQALATPKKHREKKNLTSFWKPYRCICAHRIWSPPNECFSIISKQVPCNIWFFTAWKKVHDYLRDLEPWKHLQISQISIFQYISKNKYIQLYTYSVFYSSGYLILHMSLWRKRHLHLENATVNCKLHWWLRIAIFLNFPYLQVGR